MHMNLDLRIVWKVSPKDILSSGLRIIALGASLRSQPLGYINISCPVKLCQI